MSIFKFNLDSGTAKGRRNMVIAVIALILLISSLIAGLVLIKQRQELRKKAAEPTCSSYTTKDECNRSCGYLNMGGTYWWNCQWHDVEQHCNMTETICGGTGEPNYICQTAVEGSNLAAQCIDRYVGQTFTKTVAFSSDTQYCNQQLLAGQAYQCSYECIATDPNKCDDNTLTCQDCGVTCYGCVASTAPPDDWELGAITFPYPEGYVCPEPIGGECNMDIIHALGYPSLKPDHSLNIEQCIGIYWCRLWVAECAIPVGPVGDEYCVSAPTNYPGLYTDGLDRRFYLDVYQENRGIWICENVPYPPCLATATPPPVPTPTATPTEVPVVGQCDLIRIYDTNWVQILADDLQYIQIGDTIRITVTGSASTGTFTKARFTINGELRPEVTQVKPGTVDEFYDEYTIPSGITTFIISAEVFHPILGWL